MIDKNGKLFGRINIIDLLIILIVIAALILVATKMFTPAEKGEEADTAKVVITYAATDAPTGAGKSVEQKCGRRNEQKGRADAFPQTGLVPLSEPDGEQRAAAHAKPQQNGGQKGHQRKG